MRRKQISIVAFLLIIGVVIIGSTQINAITPSSDEKIVYDQVVEISNSIDPGYAPGFLTESYILDQYGYGHCGTYGYLFYSAMIKRGFPVRGIEIHNTDGAIHFVVEVLVNGNWVVADPMIGVLYNNSFIELLKQPLLADHFKGTPKQDRGMYYGSVFYENINYLNNIGDMDSYDINYANIPMQYLNVTKKELLKDKKTEYKISWNSRIRPVFLSIMATINLQVRFETERGQGATVIGLKEYVFPIVDLKKNEVKVIVDGVQDGQHLNFSVLAPRSEITDNTPIVNPLTSYLSIASESQGQLHEEIDKLSILADSKEIWSVDIGVLTEENRTTSYVPSLDVLYTKEPINNWGPIINEDEINSRDAFYYLNKSQYNHSVIQFTVTKQQSTMIQQKGSIVQLKLRHKTTSRTGDAKLFIYNVTSNKYQLLGNLPDSKGKFVETVFDVDPQLIISLMGKKPINQSM